MTCSVESNKKIKLAPSLPKQLILNCMGILLFLCLFGCTVCLVGGAGGAGYTVGEAAADKDRGIGEVLSDKLITVEVNAAFASNKKLSMWDIDVDTYLGKVTLRGYVKSKEIIEEAIKTAQNVKGVKKVKSILVIDKGDK